LTEARPPASDAERSPADPPRRLAGSRVAIVGLGLMGGSLALALRGRCAELMGVDHDPAAVALARERGVVDFATPDLESGLHHADLIVLAAPVRAILALLDQLPNLTLAVSPVAVLDLGSTKSAITEAMRALPLQFDPIGGHPMCGREVAGLAHSDAGLFHGQTFILVPLERTSEATKQLALEVVEAVGAHPLELEAGRHDALTAAVSHLPYAAAAALVRAAEALGDDQTWQVAASGFRDTTRLAASDLTMIVDILLTNRPAMLAALARYRGELDRLAELIEAGDAEALRAVLQPAQTRRQELSK
jgi:prephenate dehydrogenase